MNIIAAWNTDAPYNDDSQLLRRVLLGNAIFSTATGLLCVFDATALTRTFAIPDALLLPGLGVQLLIFASAIIWVATRPKLPIALAWTIIGLDIAWVIGSAALLPFISNVLSASGIVALILIAFGVASFATGQIVGVRRLQRI